MIISSREFRDQQKKYFDLADQNEQLIVQRGKDKAYVIVPLNDVDRLSVNEQLIQTVQEAEAEYSKHKTIQIKDPGIYGKIYLEISQKTGSFIGFTKRGLLFS